MEQKDSIIVLSGGMDSVTLLHDRKSRIALAVTFDYGSNHNAREIECARCNTVIRAFLHCKRHRIHKTCATVRIYCMISTMVGYHNMLQPTGLSESACRGSCLCRY